MNTEITVDIPDEVIEALKEEAAKQGKSLAVLGGELLTHAVTHTERSEPHEAA